MGVGQLLFSGRMKEGFREEVAVTLSPEMAENPLGRWEQGLIPAEGASQAARRRRAQRLWNTRALC